MAKLKTDSDTPKSEDIDKALNSIFSGMLNRMGEEAKQTWGEVIDKLDLDKVKDLEDYSSHVLSPLDFQLKSQIAKSCFKTDDYDVGFLANNYYYVRRHFESIFTKFEGRFACADKSRFIMRVLLAYYKDKKEIEFNYTAEYTYHLPQAVMRDPQEVIDFYEAIKRLHGGHYDLYIKFMGEYLPKWLKASEVYRKKCEKEFGEDKAKQK